jgi:hypothetical protein
MLTTQGKNVKQMLTLETAPNVLVRIGEDKQIKICADEIERNNRMCCK